MPMLRLALDPGHMDHCLNQCLQKKEGSCQAAPARLPSLFRLEAIHVRRHKTGRRCLIEYQLFAPARGVFSVLGKIRAKGLDQRSYEAQQGLWQNGFDTACTDKISVPEPLGVLPHLNMWLQDKVTASPVIGALSGKEGPTLASRIAQAVDKLHKQGIATARSHGIQDELRILGEQLRPVIAKHPAWQERIEKILARCTQLGNRLPPAAPCPSHRDFYHDNILFDGDRLFLVDLDLYCLADPGLDMGNFIAHLMDYKLRSCGDAAALGPVLHTLRGSCSVCNETAYARQIEIYTTLSLARLVAISTRIPGREQWTTALMELCEQELDRNLGAPAKV